MVGVAGTSNAMLTIGAAQIDHTVTVVLTPGAQTTLDQQIGDGVGIFDGARAALSGTKLDANGRAGIVLRDSGKKADGSGVDVSVSGVTIGGSPLGVAANKGTANSDGMLKAGGIAMNGVAEPSRFDAKLDVQSSPCDHAKADADCAPARPGAGK